MLIYIFGFIRFDDDIQIAAVPSEEFEDIIQQLIDSEINLINQLSEEDKEVLIEYSLIILDEKISLRILRIDFGMQQCLSKLRSYASRQNSSILDQIIEIQEAIEEEFAINSMKNLKQQKVTDYFKF